MGEENSLDSILVQIGQFGKYQFKNYLLLSLPMAFNAMFGLSYLFTAGAVQYRCNITECDSLTSSFYEPWTNYTIPERENCLRFAMHKNATESCIPSDFNVNILEKCGEFKFLNDEQTISQEFQIVCRDEWKLSFVGTINNIGQFVGIPLGGFISDRYGRRFALVLAGTISAVMGIIRSFSVNYTMFCMFELFDSIAASSIYGSAFILGIELVGPKKRVIANTFLSVPYCLGQLLVGVIAMYVTNWQTLLRVLYIPALIHILYIHFLDESVRWLLSQRRNEEALRTLEKAAKMNKRSVSSFALENLIEANDNKIITTNEEPFPLMKALRKFKGRLLVCSILWFSNVLVYFGMSLNSILLGGDKYINYILVAAIEIPGLFLPLLTIDKFGRRYSLCGYLLMTGVAILVMLFVSKENITLKIVLFLIGKFMITASFQILYFYTAEIFPTNVRNTLMSFCSMFGRFGSMIAPMTLFLAKFYPEAPTILFSSCALLSGLLVLPMPETKEIILPNTVEEANHLQKEK